MDDEFLASLGAAVAAFLVTMATPTETEDGLFAPLGSSASRALRDNPVVFHDMSHMGFGAIRDADPSFDLEAFLMRVGEMFSAYHEAVDRGDLAPMRRFVDEATYMQLEPAVEKAARRYEGSRVARVHAIRPMTAHHDDGLDVVRILITAEQTGTPELLCEYWEVIRKQGVQTKPGLALTKCPNCGGPVDGLDPTRCAYCDTRLADTGSCERSPRSSAGGRRPALSCKGRLFFVQSAANGAHRHAH